LGLQAGRTYAFKIRALNSYGYSSDSAVLSLLCATVPAIPNSPTTTISNSNVVITWTAPSAQGSPITSYTVVLRSRSLVYATSNATCNGSNAAIMAATSCTVPLATLIASPWNLVYNDGIYAQITASNFYGSSPSSLTGNGATVVLVPLAPVSLT
jgi:hypothetical protein